jgi:uncharacterized repeat protein (TIGR03803 family)
MPSYPPRPAWKTTALAGLLAGLSVTPSPGAGMTKSPLVAFDGLYGATAYAGLLRASDGNYYGTTLYGGVGFIGPSTGNGTIFRITEAGAFTSIMLFGGIINGANPYAPLMEGANGNLYGTTSKGGTYGLGVIYRLSTNGALTVLASFNGTNGSMPFAGLIEGSDGDLYGTTAYGGTGFNGLPQSGSGTVFKVTTNGLLTNITLFAGANIGANPIGALIQGQDGALYGTTVSGGTNGGRGTVFKVTTNGALTSLFSFNGTNGGNPFGGFLQTSNGLLYGTTSYGGIGYSGSASSGNGTIFSITTNGVLQTLYQFTGGIDGWNPSWAKLVPGTDGNFYGTTFRGGTNGTGTAYQITPAGTFSSLLSFDTEGNGGISPYGGLTVGPFGSFYGTTSSAGSNGYGTVFQLLPAPPILQNARFTGGLFRFSLSALPGQKFQSQYKTNINQVGWINVGSVVTAIGSTIEFADPPGSDAKRFYRVTLIEVP